MNWQEKSKKTIEKIVSDVGIQDKDFLKKRIDEECPFCPDNFFAMRIWREERQKAISPIFLNKQILCKPKHKIKDFYDKKEEF